MLQNTHTKINNPKKEDLIMLSKIPKQLTLAIVLGLFCTLGFAQTTFLSFDETAADWTTGSGNAGNVIILEDNFEDFSEGAGSMQVDVELIDMAAWGTWTDIGYEFPAAVDFTGYSEMRFKMKLLKEPTSNVRSVQFTCDVFEESGELWRYPEDLDIFYSPHTDADGAEWFEVTVPFSRFVQPSWYSTPDNGLFDPGAITKFAFGVHADSAASFYHHPFDTVSFLIDDLYLANPVEDGVMHNFDESAENWATNAGNENVVIILEDDYENIVEGTSAMGVEIHMLGPYAFWGTWTDVAYTFDTPVELGNATELRFDIKMLTKPLRKNLIFTADLFDVDENELHRWGGDPERPGHYGLFEHIDIDYHEWREIVIPLDDMFRPPWATTFDDEISTAAGFAFGVHTTQAQVDDTTNAAVDDTVAFVIDNLRLTHASTVVGIDTDEPQLARSFELNQNYPNPFNPTTSISYSIPASEEVTLAIYNIRGELVNTLYSGYQTAGRHEATWNGTDDAGMLMSSGIYVYSLKSASQSISRQMLLIK